MYKELSKQVFARVVLTTLLWAALAGCSQQSATSEAVQEDGLQPRESGLDSVAAAFAFDLSGAKVYLNPLTIQYRKQYPRAGARLDSQDYELNQKDFNRLQALMEKTFAEKFLAPRHSTWVADQRQADYTLQLNLDKFALAAPLKPSLWLWRVYTDQSAYGVLSGELRDRDGKLVMRFRDRRDIGENFANFGDNLERFTSVTFWADMRIDLRRAFIELDKSLR